MKILIGQLVLNAVDFSWIASAPSNRRRYRSRCCRGGDLQRPNASGGRKPIVPRPPESSRGAASSKPKTAPPTSGLADFGGDIGFAPARCLEQALSSYCGKIISLFSVGQRCARAISRSRSHHALMSGFFASALNT